MFKVGDSVVCTDDSDQLPYGPIIKEGNSYTISDIETDCDGNWYCLYEMGDEWCWEEKHFALKEDWQQAEYMVEELVEETLIEVEA